MGKGRRSLKNYRHMGFRAQGLKDTEHDLET